MKLAEWLEGCEKDREDRWEESETGRKEESVSKSRGRKKRN